jgi:hypothetical protein
MSTPPAPLTMHDLARQVAGNLSSFSDAYPFTAPRAARAAAFLAAGTPPHMKHALLMDASITMQWLAVHQNRVVVLTKPVVATSGTGEAIFLASLGDSLGQATPVSFAHSVATGQVVVLVTQDDHAALDLPGCTAIPGQLDPPPPADGSVSTEQASIDRLHFDVSTGAAGSVPVFGVLPLIYPLALGESPISQPLTDPFPTTGRHTAGLRVWYHGLKYLSTYNSQSSLHAHPGLFASADLPATLFSTSTLVDSIDVAIQTVDAMSPQFQHVATIHHETSQGAIMAHAGGLNVPPAGGVPTGGAGDPGLAKALTTAFAPLVASLGTSAVTAHTQAEREHLSDIKDVAIRYQICWGRIDTVIDPIDGSVSEVVVFPQLSAALLAVLSPSKAAKAETSYQESFTNHLRARSRSSTYFDGTAEYDVKAFGVTGVQALRGFLFATTPPTNDPEELKEKMTILHYARTDPGCVDYKTRQEDGRLLTRQRLVNEDSSKLKRKTTDLYFHGMIRTADDLKTAIANFWIFTTWAFKDDIAANPPTILKTLEEMIFLLNSPDGRKWTALHKNLPHLYLHLFLAVQHMLAPFIALGNVQEYRQAVLNGTPIDVAGYKSALALATLQVTKVGNIIHNGDLGVFSDPPSIMRIFYPDPTDAPNSKKGGGPPPTGPNRTPELSSPIPRRQNPNPVTPPSTGSGEGNRLLGIMKFSGQGRVPTPVDLFPHPTRPNKFAYLCGNGSTIGKLCHRSPAQCNFVHAYKNNDLPPPHRATLKTFIQNHVDLTLTHPG